MRPAHTRPGKMQGRFLKGVFLGRVDRVDEGMVAQGNKLVWTTKFLRLPESDQWSAAWSTRCAASCLGNRKDRATTRQGQFSHQDP